MQQPRACMLIPGRWLLVQKKINLTKTVRKLPITEDGGRAGHYIHDDRQLDIKYDHPAVGVPLFLQL